MRVSTNSFSSPGHILAQHAWMRDLARETGLRVREPLRTPSGADLAVVGSAGRDFHVVAAHWLDGEEVGECAVAHGHALGRAMAVMHSHAETWTMPAGGRLSDFADPLMGEEDRLRPAYAGRPDDLAVVDWAFRRCQAAMSAAAQRSRPTVIHGDLHGATCRGIRVARGARLRRLRPGRGTTGADVEGLVAARQLLLANDLLLSLTAELREMAASYLDRTVEGLGRWRGTGGSPCSRWTTTPAISVRRPTPR